MNASFDTVSTNGLCNIFAEDVATALNLEVYMIVHVNPHWFYEDQTKEEIKAAIAGQQVEIIHCVLADNDGYIFDANGYIYNYDKDQYMNISDDFFFDTFEKQILSQCEHDTDDIDPIDILCFDKDKLTTINHHARINYMANAFSDCLDERYRNDFRQWSVARAKAILADEY